MKNALLMKKPFGLLAALALGTALLGACQNKSGGDGDSTSQGSPGSDTTNPSSKTGAHDLDSLNQADPPRTDSVAPPAQPPR